MRVGKVLKNRQHRAKSRKTARRNAKEKAKLNKATKRVKSLPKTAKYFRS